MKILICILILLLVFLQYKFWGAHGGLWQTFKLRHTVAAQQKINQKSTQRNQKLAEQVYQLKHNKNSVETLAREKLGMIKPGEKYYRVVDGG